MNQNIKDLFKEALKLLNDPKNERVGVTIICCPFVVRVIGSVAKLELNKNLGNKKVIT